MTLALAITGVVLGVLSLGWQAWTWARSGPVVKVEASSSFPIYDGHMGEHHVSVKAINRGRAPATITGWGIGFPDGGGLFVPTQLSWSTRLPHRLEPHSSAEFHVEAEEVRRTAHQKGVPYDKLKPWVRLADGTTVESKGVPLAD
jgi:hypothetical protein